MELADKMAEHVETKGLEFVRKRVTVLGTFSLSQLKIDRVTALECHLNALVCQLETELLCQSRGNQTQIVQFWVPANWWQHLKRTILHRWFERAFVEGEDSSYQTKGWGFRRWIGQRIEFRLKSVMKSAEWEILDSYPMADVEVPSNFGAPVRIVIPKGEVAAE